MSNHPIQSGQGIYDRAYSAKYRDSDEVEVQSDNHEHLCKILSQLSGSFGYPIVALDLGCGTGRYFHCLRNVDTLMGIDASLEMLWQAQRPVKDNMIDIGRINLMCGDVANFHLNQRFNLIYSIGVFGEHVSWDIRVCNSLFDLLRPGGKLFFTVVDVFSKYQFMSKRRRIAETVNLILPFRFRRMIRDRLGTFYTTERELTAILKKSKFQRHEIVRRVSTARLWTGAHYECLAVKGNTALS